MVNVLYRTFLGAVFCYLRYNLRQKIRRKNMGLFRFFHDIQMLIENRRADKNNKQ